MWKDLKFSCKLPSQFSVGGFKWSWSGVGAAASAIVYNQAGSKQSMQYKVRSKTCAGMYLHEHVQIHHRDILKKHSWGDRGRNGTKKYVHRGHSHKYSVIQGYSKAFQGNLSHSKAIQCIPRLPKAFWGHPRLSEAIQGFLRLSKAFWGYPRLSEAIQGIPRLSTAFRGYPRPTILNLIISAQFKSLASNSGQNTWLLCPISSPMWSSNVLLVLHNFPVSSDTI